MTERFNMDLLGSGSDVDLGAAVAGGSYQLPWWTCVPLLKRAVMARRRPNRDYASTKAANEVVLNDSAASKRIMQQFMSDPLVRHAVMIGEPGSTSPLDLEEIFTTRQLFVKVIYAKGLAAARPDGTSDPFILVKCGPEMHRTGVAKRKRDAVYAETFNFSGASVKQGSFVLSVEAWSYDEWHPDDFLGQAEIDLREVPLQSPTSCTAKLFVMKGNGKKDRHAFGEVKVVLWTTPSDHTSQFVTPGVWGYIFENLTPETMSLCAATKQLPSVQYSKWGTLYEEPCIAYIKVSLVGISGLLSLLSSNPSFFQLLHEDCKRRRAYCAASAAHGAATALSHSLTLSSSNSSSGRRAAGLANQWRQRMFHKLLPPSDTFNNFRNGGESGRSLLSLPEMDSELLDEQDDLVDEDDTPDVANEEELIKVPPATRAITAPLPSSAATGSTRAALQPPPQYTLRGSASTSVAQDERSSAAGPTRSPIRSRSVTFSDGSGGDAPLACPVDFSGQRRPKQPFVYIKLVYNKQVHRSHLKRLSPSGDARHDEGFVFAAVRPLAPRPLEVSVYLAVDKRKKGRLVSRTAFDMNSMLQQCGDAPRSAPHGEAPPELIRNHKWADEFALPVLRWPLNHLQGHLRMHVGVADADYRAKMYKVPLFDTITYLSGLGPPKDIAPPVNLRSVISSSPGGTNGGTVGVARGSGTKGVVAASSTAAAIPFPMLPFSTAASSATPEPGGGTAAAASSRARYVPVSPPAGGTGSAVLPAPTSATVSVTLSPSATPASAMSTSSHASNGVHPCSGTAGGTAGDASGETAGGASGSTVGRSAGNVFGGTAGGAAGDTSGRTGGGTASSWSSSSAVSRDGGAMTALLEQRDSVSGLGGKQKLPQQRATTAVDEGGHAAAARSTHIAAGPNVPGRSPFANGVDEAWAPRSASSAPPSGRESAAEAATLGTPPQPPPPPKSGLEAATQWLGGAVAKVMGDGNSDPTTRLPEMMPIGTLIIRVDKVEFTLPNVDFFGCLKYGPHWLQLGNHHSGKKGFVSPDGPHAVLEMRLPIYDASDSFTAVAFVRRARLLKSDKTDVYPFCRNIFPIAGLPLNAPFKRTVTTPRMYSEDGTPHTWLPGQNGYATHTIYLSGKVILHDRLRLLKSYVLRPPRPPEWYTLGLDDADQQLVEKLYRKMICRWFEHCSTPVPTACVKVVLATERDAFLMEILKGNWARLVNGLNWLLRLRDGVNHIMTWDNQCHSAMAYCLLCGVCFWITPTVALLLGAAFLAIWGQRHRSTNAGVPKVEEADEDEVDDADVAPPASNPYGELKRKYEEVVGLALTVQNLLDDAACFVERLQSMHNWRNALATKLFALAVAAAAVAIYLFGLPLVLCVVLLWVFRPPFLRDPEPTPIENYFWRLPTLQSVTRAARLKRVE